MMTSLLKKKRPVVFTLLALGLIGVFYFYRLDAPVLWSDESAAAAISRSVLKNGIPSGYDGRNLIAFRNCNVLGEGLLLKKIPWVQYYVGALSQYIFGRTTFGARILFVVIGWATFFPLLGLLRERTHHAHFLTTLLMLSPQIILFQRNARYYPILILLIVLLLYLVFSEKISNRVRYGTVIPCSILLFHTHPLAAVSTFLALSLASLLVCRRHFRIAIFGGIVGLVSWLAWYLTIPHIPMQSSQFLFPMISEDPERWKTIFLRGLFATFYDIDFINGFPLVVCFVFLIYCLVRKRSALLKIIKDPLCATILFNLVIQALFNAITIGYETPYRLALLRFMPHLVLLLGIVLFLMIRFTINNEKVALALFSVILVTNIFGLSFWYRPSDPKDPREWKYSWWPSVYSELIFPPPDPLKLLITEIAQSGSDQDSVLVVRPRFLADTFTFYLGDKLLIQPNIKINSPCANEVLKTIGLDSYKRVLGPPSQIVAFLPDPIPLRGYKKFAFSHYRRRADATRPELTRHNFHNTGRREQYFVWYKASP